MSKLVIVESPAKVKTIRKYLPDDFVVDSCVGHVRDLPSNKKEIPKAIEGEPWADLGVNVDEDYQPVYVTIRGKGKVLQRLKKELKGADALYLATDEDREGESISWHLTEALQPDVPVKRMVFNEITKEAIQHALENPRDLDMDLVQAQETRRILDRLYGYTLSPLLWKKIGGNLSAGRVQSPAIRIIVNRERERRAFRSATYWDLKALLSKADIDFEAVLLELDGDRVATGADFDRDTGRLKEGSDARVLGEDEARRLEAQVREGTWQVASVEQRERQSKPPAPFITSTLQQEANSRLDLSPGETMRIAQRLYEDGLITYMRTDSTTLSEEALEGAKKAILDKWGGSLHQRRTYEAKKSKAAQEAHEAIRPAGATFTDPGDAGLRGADLKLYKLIFDRTLASQMPNERYTSTTVLVDVDEARFKATGKHVDFTGYRLAWPTMGDDERELPQLVEGDTVACKGIEALSHETQPPSRYTEASLVRALEEEGIGRPSTYAETISKIIDKEYVVKQGRSLVPTLTAFAVVHLLETHFPRLVDTEFTAHMEEALDSIAVGQAEWLPYLREFYEGETGLKPQVDAKMEDIDPQEARVIPLEGLPDHVTVRIGRFGPYVEAEHEGETVKVDLPDQITPDELTEELIGKLVERRAQGPQSLGTDPDTGLDVLVLTGRYGPYVQRGDRDDVEGKPDRASLPDGMEMEDVTLEDALYLLSLPQKIGDHPAGGEVLVGIGRYGPYVLHQDGENRTYANVESYEKLRSVTLDEALDLLTKKKKRTKRGTLRTMGEHPDTGETIELRGGRYGPYFKMGKTNKSLPKDMDVDEATMEDAVFLTSLPVTLGEHPTGGTVFKDLGRYGPYVCHEDEDGNRTYANLKGYDHLQAVELEEALQLIAAEA